MRYGEHHAKSTDALAWLLTHDEPVAQQELSAVLSCRMALLTAHRERCELAVRGADVRRAVFRDTKAGRDFGALARSGTAALAQLLDEYPTFAGHADRLTDVLQRVDLSPQGAAWVQAAKHAVLATEALATTSTWKAEPGQGWMVAADVADVAETLTRLDRRLEESADRAEIGWRAGLVTHTAELALAARHVGYVARSGDLDAGVDAVVRRETRRGVVAVRALEDLPVATAAAAQLLERNTLSVTGLRRFAIMQAEISHLCAEAAGPESSYASRGAFLRRDTRLRALAGASARVASVGPSQDGPLLAQAQEIGRGLLRAHRERKPISEALLTDLDVGQRGVVIALAENVRRALYGGRYLVVDDESVTLRWRRSAPGEEPKVLQAAEVEGGEQVVAGFSCDLDFAVLRLRALEGSRTADSRRSGDASPARERLRATLLSEPSRRRPHTPGSLPKARL